MSGSRGRVQSIVRTELFWQSLEACRTGGGGNYLSIRAKAEQLMRHRLTHDTPLSREKPFTEGPLRGLWHFHLSASPLAVLIYSIDGGRFIAHKVADHRDYSWGGQRMGADGRTRRNIDRSDHSDVPSPLWESMPRWRTAEELIAHPDLPELAPAVMDALLQEVEDEALEPRRFIALHGRAPRPNSIEEEQYLDSMIRLSEVLRDIMIHSYGAHHDEKTGWSRTRPKP